MTVKFSILDRKLLFDDEKLIKCFQCGRKIRRNLPDECGGDQRVTVGGGPESMKSEDGRRIPALINWVIKIG